MEEKELETPANFNILKELNPPGLEYCTWRVVVYEKDCI